MKNYRQIVPLQLQDKALAKELLDLQKRSYSVESTLIDFSDIPPLHDSIDSLQKCNEIFYGYKGEKDLIGAISYKVFENVLDIHRLMVDPACFRKGVAESLLRSVEFREEGITKIIVSTPEKNKPAINLYKKLGYLVTGKETIDSVLKICHFEKTLR